MGAAEAGAAAVADEVLMKKPSATAAIPAATAPPITSPTTSPGKGEDEDVLRMNTREGGVVPSLTVIVVLRVTVVLGAVVPVVVRVLAVPSVAGRVVLVTVVGAVVEVVAFVVEVEVEVEVEVDVDVDVEVEVEVDVDVEVDVEVDEDEDVVRFVVVRPVVVKTHVSRHFLTTSPRHDPTQASALVIWQELSHVDTGLAMQFSAHCVRNCVVHPDTQLFCTSVVQRDPQSLRWRSRHTAWHWCTGRAAQRREQRESACVTQSFPHETRVSNAHAVAQFSCAVKRTDLAHVATLASRHSRWQRSRRRRTHPELHLLLAVTRHVSRHCSFFSRLQAERHVPQGFLRHTLTQRADTLRRHRWLHSTTFSILHSL